MEDKLHLVGIHTVDHLFTNLPRLNWLMDRVHRNEFHLMTLKTMHKFIITGRYGEFNPPDRLVFTPCAYMATGPDDPPHKSLLTPRAYMTRAPEPRSPSFLGGVLKAFKGLALRSNPESGQEREHDDANYGNVLFDSGANCCVTHCKDDFKGRLHLIQDSRQVEGIGKALQIAGVGTVTWVFKADNGTHRTIRVPAYYVPSANSRVASLQVILRTLRKERISLDDRQLRLEERTGVPTDWDFNIFCARDFAHYPAQ